MKIRFVCHLIAILAAFTPLACAQAPVTILGLSSRDKVLAAFWAQQQNANTTMAGLNGNATTRLSDSLLPLTITGKILSGTFTVTNSMEFQSYDADATQFEHWNYGWNGGFATSSNTVARVGRAEGLAFKSMVYTKFFSDLSTPMDGILRANGTNYVSYITPKTGTNTYYINGNYFVFVEGVLTDFVGSTNITGTGVTSVNGLTAAALQIRTNSTGSDFNITQSSATNININIPTASASARGLLSAANWSTFNSKQAGDSTLTALAAYNEVGIMVQTSVDAFHARRIVGTNGVLVINGDGVAGDIVIDSTNSPAAFLSAAGDLLTHDGTNMMRLPVGTDGQMLIADSGSLGGLKWTNAPTAASVDTNADYTWTGQHTFTGAILNGSEALNVWGTPANGESFISVHVPDVDGGFNGNELAIVTRLDGSNYGIVDLNNATNGAGLFVATKVGGVQNQFTITTTATRVYTTYQLGTSTCQDIAGVGDPSGSVAAPVGSTYRRLDGGSTSTFYVKESGSGGTSGWVAK